MKEKILSTFESFWDAFILLLPNLLIALFFLLLFHFIGRIVYGGFRKMFVKSSGESFSITFVAKAIKWLFYLIGTIVAMQILGFSGIANSLLTGAGISALIVGFAFKDIFENFLAGILLAMNRPFEKGNIIEISGFKGTVKNLDLRFTHIRNIEGKDIFIPNSNMIKGVLVNYTKDGLLRLDFDIGLDVPSDLIAARKLIIAYLQQQPEILKSPVPDVLTTTIGSHTVDIKVLFWINIFKDKKVPPSYLGATIKSRVISEVKALLLEKGFNLPSPILEHKLYEQDKAIPLQIITNE